ncbi:hypothetical protein [Microvirga sp. VF16]|uniref:hypothetical protein n=1 Tax=Microvirga sp. VF16 TaxID=2807101 RepID=UPI00193CFF69|nr:hypothetical protein [Microvirga sp. VF16]QRM34302.1 hypothetical protein JO965_34325 [Microvirga sp. VF16]
MMENVLTHRIIAAAAQAFWCQDDFLHEIQITLAALADVEYRREKDRERLKQRFGPDAVKHRLWVERESRYQADREPYLRKLEQLRRRIRSDLFSGL